MAADPPFAKGKLAEAWRRVIIPRLAIGMSILTGGCAVQRTTVDPEDHINPKTPPGHSQVTSGPPGDLPITTDDVVHVAPAVRAQRNLYREQLLKGARHDFGALSRFAETGYSSTLHTAQVRLTNYLTASANPVNNSVSYIDPAKFDVGVAFGFTPFDAVKNVLALQGVYPSDDRITGATRDMIAKDHFRLQDVDAYTQSPHALFNTRRDAADVCVVVPSSAFALTIDIRGMTTQQQILFTNRHESWHCLDHFFVEQSLDAKDVAAVPEGTLADNVNNRTAMAIYAINYNKESLADVGAVGDMIRHDGYGLDLVHTIAAWRQRYPNDPQHMSSPSLNGFRAKVERMGLDAFRALSDEQATQLYVDTVKEHGATPRSVYIQIRYETASATERAGYLANAHADDDISRAVNVLGFYLDKRVDGPNGPLSPGEQKLMQRLADWNAGGLLEQRAFDLDGAVTPASLTRAYGDMLRGFQSEMDRGTADALVPAQMGKLQQTYIYQVKNTDYVEANRIRGVDITRILPVRNDPAARAPAVAVAGP